MTAFKNKFSPLVFLLLLFLLNSSVCQRINDTGTAQNSTDLGFSSIHFVKPESHYDVESNASTYRLKRSPNTSRKIADIAARLSKEKETEPKGQNVVHIDEATRKLRLLGRNQSNREYNVDQEFNKKNDRIRVLHSRNMQDRQYFTDYNCNFENDCKWTWRKDIANGFYITTGGNHLTENDTGPKVDANKRQFGSYLILRLPPKSKEFHVISPLFGPTTPTCKLTFDVYQENMENGTIRVIGDKTIDNVRGHPLNNHTQWVVQSFRGNNNKEWKKEEILLGKITTNFTILVEVVAAEQMVPGATVAFDNLQLYECFTKTDETCSQQQYKCNRTKECVNSTAICDFNQDCPHGDDEALNCHMMPYGSRCTFEEDDWCGWANADDKNVLKWSRHNGSTPNNFTGPHYDHTFLNSSGNYLYVNMLNEKSSFASQAVLRSVIFNPPPKVHGNSSSRYFNSCAIRFYLHKTGKHKSALLIQVNEITPTENKTTKIYWSYMEDHGDQWIREVYVLPNITNRYFMHFEAKKGYRYSDIAIDDVSLSPECFGINIPEEELQGYNYWNPKLDVAAIKETVDDFKNKTYYKISTCNNTGRYGPTSDKCRKAYNGSSTSIRVLHDAGLSGVQKWIVPEDNHYTFILAGASGGKGSSGMGSSRGAVVRAVMELSRGQEIFLMVGQEGNSACLKFIGQINNCSTSEDAKQKPQTVLIRDLLNLDIIDNGGGGGGGTFLFLRNRTKSSIPIAVAAGGGGLGLGRYFDNDKFHGQGLKKVVPVSGSSFGLKGAGAGGGWKNPPGVVSHYPMTGGSLVMGGIGGKACYTSYDGKGDGGYGGGGGGCRNGGGGGGYAGGNANSTNGDGGVSYVDTSKTLPGFAKAEMGQNAGPGYVIIIPAIDGCDCDYHCVALDEKRSETMCICPQTWKLSDNKKSCIPVMINRDPPYPPWLVVVLIITIFCLTFLFGLMCFILYNRYQQQVSGLLRRKGCPISDVQLSRLRHASGSVTTQYNPNYEFGGVVTTISDLQHIPRDQLRLVKALGQGAFGEVYQGFYRQRPCDTVEMPVAVKTLGEMTVKQNEDDFLTEALIMSKFNHPNIVHFIGVCFDIAPKFIVLELLTGGDLKNFLRESRPKPGRPSPITMKDLVFIAIDIARGCRYLEEKRFIHRDIAARNCLLTTKGPGRVAKIADFGMSRDIYRADYYRKDGKAMLPVKWMPPEAFLEGIFSSKTDVWSFGILLWEIQKMGFMPYTGCTNKEVMDLVMQGGRLEKPENCPGPIYGIMASCWHPQPEDRPSFATILERLGYCSQDPDVVNAPLPVFYGTNPSSERDATIIRPSDSNDNCLQVLPNNPSDYLVPNYTHPSTPEVVESTSSVEKLIPDSGRSLNETSFMLPNSRSTQPLLQCSNSGEEDGTHTASGHHSNNLLKIESTVKSGVSLDASALAKSLMTPNHKKRYANLDENGGILVANGGHSIRLATKGDDEIIHC
ncbi:tyrosine-protein kinase receptor isoform X2 [Anthonomus grandis grandis]|uniref:tyrosine-protein kinase receptor isoform X2 n=1 Tax=Anthonomus grandis grandis TaxID=2921223 RepID=UPI0021654D2D|nr:tyrosine-protein kinase receptor isoform X2 [Anthonomus grandis grandis]